MSPAKPSPHGELAGIRLDLGAEGACVDADAPERPRIRFDEVGSMAFGEIELIEEPKPSSKNRTAQSRPTGQRWTYPEGVLAAQQDVFLEAAHFRGAG